MNYSSIINQFIGATWYFILIIILVIIIKSSRFKGITGEFIVNILARMFLDKHVYHLIKNVTLPTENGTTQIDHIIVSKYGVFVVETKNMKGWIYGDPDHQTWTQKIYKHSTKFQNPLHQNYKHLKTLESLLGLNDQQVHSLVVFVGDSTFKTEMPENVTYGRGYVRFIKSKIQPVLSETEVDAILSKIGAGMLTRSFKTNSEHVKHVNHIVSEKKKENTCPRCGSPMVLRETKNGQNAGKQFLGCSRYPKCKGVLNIT
ncbi:MAG: nuclease [Deltaproteobacteria bacterium HGW-Deltaproteobacteria-1]|nr:MAG: nuclease [Deltaproteobacteria bacterium HGW-Deltaproteobacteria-1]